MKFSHSKIELFKQCPFKFKLKYIDKIEIKQDFKALTKGRAVHSLLENFEDFKHDGSEVSNIVLIFSKSELGKDILSRESKREFEIKLDENMEPCGVENYKLVGYVDRINLTENGIELIDFKTGKYKEPEYQTFDQLITYAIYCFQKIKINEIKLRYIYVEHNKENSLVVKREQLNEYKTKLQNEIKMIEDTTEFCKNKSKLCDWCEYKDICEGGSVRS